MPLFCSAVSMNHFKNQKLLKKFFLMTWDTLTSWRVSYIPASKSDHSLWPGPLSCRFFHLIVFPGLGSWCWFSSSPGSSNVTTECVWVWASQWGDQSDRMQRRCVLLWGCWSLNRKWGFRCLKGAGSSRMEVFTSCPLGNCHWLISGREAGVFSLRLFHLASGLLHFSAWNTLVHTFLITTLWGRSYHYFPSYRLQDGVWQKRMCIMAQTGL